jgi:hypothetical protein
MGSLYVDVEPLDGSFRVAGGGGIGRPAQQDEAQDTEESGHASYTNHHDLLELGEWMGRVAFRRSAVWTL